MLSYPVRASCVEWARRKGEGPRVPSRPRIGQRGRAGSRGERRGRAAPAHTPRGTSGPSGRPPPPSCPWAPAARRKERELRETKGQEREKSGKGRRGAQGARGQLALARTSAMKRWLAFMCCPPCHQPPMPKAVIWQRRPRITIAGRSEEEDKKRGGACECVGCAHARAGRPSRQEPGGALPASGCPRGRGRRPPQRAARAGSPPRWLGRTPPGGARRAGPTLRRGGPWPRRRSRRGPGPRTPGAGRGGGSGSSLEGGSPISQRAGWGRGLSAIPFSSADWPDRRRYPSVQRRQGGAFLLTWALHRLSLSAICVTWSSSDGPAMHTTPGRAAAAREEADRRGRMGRAEVRAAARVQPASGGGTHN